MVRENERDQSSSPLFCFFFLLFPFLNFRDVPPFLSFLLKTSFSLPFLNRFTIYIYRPARNQKPFLRVLPSVLFTSALLLWNRSINALTFFPELNFVILFKMQFVNSPFFSNVTSSRSSPHPSYIPLWNTTTLSVRHASPHLLTTPL